MQELVSFISIMLGVIILTAWVMWIMLRPSGDIKAKEFARESAREGLTRAVMENNELKNKITRLERELKVLMSAGYGKVKEAKEREESQKVERKAVDANSLPQEKFNEEAEKLEEESQKINETAVGANTFAQEKIQETVAKPEAEPIPEPEPEPEVEPAAEPQLEIVPETEAEVKQEAEPEAEVKLKPVAADEHENVRTHQSAYHKITDEAEKKKIAEYLANVEKTTERQKAEVKAITRWKATAPDIDDDLKVIKGIGLHLEIKLKQAGITSYEQIANFNEDDIRRVSDVIGSYPRRIKREEWVEQARKLVVQT